ncbi:MAG: helix-turn-helix transcriptional regulator, partial [Prevotella sp.]|nr:helix-turn-helix transcriptional regulator [Prevotella sp.]
LNANNNDDNTPKVSSAEADATGPVLCLADRKFIDKVDMLISQHLDDPDFNIDKLANALCMGRTKLFGMAKKLLGMSPNKYIQNERMRVAAELLTEGELTVTEVSYRVGIQDPSYFNKCFKARYGVVPSKFKG